MKTVITHPPRLWTRQEIIAKPSPVPREPGVYGWYFRNLPGSVHVADCLRYDDLVLAYVGISPKAPPTSGKPPSSQTLRSRIRYHLTGNCYGSTLRLTLGCLLADDLGIQLRRVSASGRMTFGPGERVLSEWLAENAYVTWLVNPRPWELEERLIRKLSLPLNLDQNQDHPFYPALSTMRREAKRLAGDLPILQNKAL